MLGFVPAAISDTACAPDESPSMAATNIERLNILLFLFKFHEIYNSRFATAYNLAKLAAATPIVYRTKVLREHPSPGVFALIPPIFFGLYVPLIGLSNGVNRYFWRFFRANKRRFF